MGRGTTANGSSYILTWQKRPRWKGKEMIPLYLFPLRHQRIELSAYADELRMDLREQQCGAREISGTACRLEIGTQ